MNEWRPSNWEEESVEEVKELFKIPTESGFPIMIQDGFGWETTKMTIYQAGANAILRAQEKLGFHMPALK